MKLLQLQKTFILMLTTIVLQGCVASAFVAGAAAGGAVVYDKRDLATMKQDLETSHAINRAVRKDKKLASDSHIVVATFNHVVLLTGQVPTPEMRGRAEEIAQNSPNVKRIYNEINVVGTTSALTRSSDAWITAKIKGELLVTRGLHSSQIKVVTEDGTVYLMGLVTRRIAQKAVEVSRHVKGVQRVVKIFEYEV